MCVIRLIAPALMRAAVASPVFADVTLRLKGIRGLAGDQQSEITEYRKGLQWRTDHSSNGLSRRRSGMRVRAAWSCCRTNPSERT